MRISRVREFKDSTEITIVVEGNDAQAICHAIGACGKDCWFPKRQKLGFALLREYLWPEMKKAWKAWKKWQD